MLSMERCVENRSSPVRTISNSFMSHTFVHDLKLVRINGYFCCLRLPCVPGSWYWVPLNRFITKKRFVLRGVHLATVRKNLVEFGFAKVGLVFDHHISMVSPSFSLSPIRITNCLKIFIKNTFFKCQCGFLSPNIVEPGFEFQIGLWNQIIRTKI